MNPSFEISNSESNHEVIPNLYFINVNFQQKAESIRAICFPLFGNNKTNFRFLQKETVIGVISFNLINLFCFAAAEKSSCVERGGIGRALDKI